jgi:hypothetical protein
MKQAIFQQPISTSSETFQVVVFSIHHLTLSRLNKDISNEGLFLLIALQFKSNISQDSTSN